MMPSAKIAARDSPPPANRSYRENSVPCERCAYSASACTLTPGVNVQALAEYAQRSQGTLFSLYDLFAGGGLSRAAIFALGIMPYISASIVFQLAGPVFPIIEKMQRDEEGRKKLTQ